MREILVDHARKHRAAKRRGGEKIPLDEAISLAPERGHLLIGLDDALTELARFEARKAPLVSNSLAG